MSNKRACYLSVVQQRCLEHECRLLSAAFGFHTYLVGSVMQRPDYRDVDLRCILPDEEFRAMFGTNKNRLELLNTAISEWLSIHSGVPNVDFQFQERTDANDKHRGPRSFAGHPLSQSEHHED